MCAPVDDYWLILFGVVIESLGLIQKMLMRRLSVSGNLFYRNNKCSFSSCFRYFFEKRINIRFKRFVKVVGLSHRLRFRSISWYCRKLWARGVLGRHFQIWNWLEKTKI